MTVLISRVVFGVYMMTREGTLQNVNLRKAFRVTISKIKSVMYLEQLISLLLLKM